MESTQKLNLLSSDMAFEPSEELHCPKLNQRQQDSIVTHHATLPNGQRIRLLKTLLTSVCERNCAYCPFRAGRDFRRATFKPADFASLFANLYRAGIVEGLFLSSGILNGGIPTQDKLLETAELLRRKHKFLGYLHLKLMPGAEYSQVEHAMQLADRVSINLEAPNAHRLKLLAPAKTFSQELLRPLEIVESIRRSRDPYAGWNHRWPSMTTQFVVGGVGDTDEEILTTTSALYRDLRISRAYFSTFRPVPDTPLENEPAGSLRREARLYQASFLLRDYGYQVGDLPFTQVGNLREDIDPKRAWADQHLRQQPVELNNADRQALLRIPGIGLRTADRILSARRQNRLTEIAHLKKLGVQSDRALPYILLDGHRPPLQLTLL